MTKWEFNEEVAKNFDFIADTSIPKYRVIIHNTVRLIEDLFKEATIIDVGCATGNTLDALKNKGFTNVFGVDNSPAMIREAYKKGHSVFSSDELPKQIAPYDVVIANWTLHFIQPDKREEYINDIYNNLKNGGVFILSEKIDEDQTEYMNFKKANFLTEKEIEEKTEALKGVLITKPIEWYENILSKFSQVHIIDHTYCFVTFLVVK